MANFRYFATCNGAIVRLESVYHSGTSSVKAAAFTGYCPSCGQRHTCERKVEYRKNPSMHECDSRCMAATGRNMTCECSCGGANHGKGKAA